MGIRTTFNLLGPLTNPAGATRQIVGVPRPELTQVMARALMLLGSKRAWVVHGAGGIDELSTTGHTKVSECRDGAVHTFFVQATEFGLAKATADDLRGGDAVENAAIIRAVFAGTAGPARDIVLLNAGAALFVAGRTLSVREGISVAADAIDSGAARNDARPDGAGLSGRGGRMTRTPDLLGAIVAATEKIVEVRRGRESFAAVERRAAAAAPRGAAFLSALSQPGRSNVIAECKRRSPSRGVLAARLRPHGDRPAVRGWRGRCDLGPHGTDVFRRRAGTSGVGARRPSLCPSFAKTSSSTSISCSRRARTAPMRRFSSWRRSSRPISSRLQRRAWELDLAALVEVHDDEEMARAIDSGARIIGVNNRNLRTLEVDVAASRRLGARIPAGVVGVSESGLTSRADLEELAGQGYQAFLIGERFMTAPDPARALRELIGAELRDPQVSRTGPNMSTN